MPRDPSDIQCETMHCPQRPVRYISCEGEGAFPYCEECAGVLLRSGEVDRGPVGVSERMVRRGVERLQRLSGYHTDEETVRHILEAALDSPAAGQEHE